MSNKLVRGSFLLILRQALLQTLNIGGSILLARLLSPESFGLYAVVTFFLAFLVAFGDAGLAASLIRSQDEPSAEDFSAIFSMQLVFVSVAGVVFWFLAPWIAQAYSVSASEDWVFRLMALSLFVTSFMVIPQVRLERELRFERIAIVEIAQALVFNVIAVGMAWRGFGPISFGVAMLARAFTGAILLNMLSRLSVQWLWDWQKVKSHMRFGLAFQGVKIACFIKDSITPIFIGLVMSAQSVGYLNWAGLLANYPVIGLFVLQRIYMPAFARLQYDRAALVMLVDKVIWATNALVAPIAVLTLVFSDEITRCVFGDKWLPALYFLPFMWTANLFLPTVTPAMGLLDALGYSNVNFRATLLWMGLTWGLGLPMLYVWGLTGFVAAVVVVNVAHVLLLRSAQVLVPFNIIANIKWSWSIASVIGLFLLVVSQWQPVSNAWILLTYLLVGAILYIAALHKAYPGRMIGWVNSIRGA